jgi:hypothetical protein
MQKKAGSKPKNKGGLKNKGQHNQATNISVGNISNSSGIAIGSNAQAQVNQFNLNNNIEDAFALIDKETARIKDEGKKNDAYKALSELKIEAKKGEQADEKRVQGWLAFLANIAPDVWEVAIETFINPVKGIGMVFKKVSEKAKAESE